MTIQKAIQSIDTQKNKGVDIDCISSSSHKKLWFICNKGRRFFNVINSAKIKKYVHDGK